MEEGEMCGAIQYPEWPVWQAIMAWVFCRVGQRTKMSASRLGLAKSIRAGGKQTVFPPRFLLAHN